MAEFLEFALDKFTFKVELPSPVRGTIITVNETLEMEAEVINQDPYGAGWLAIIEAGDWPTDQVNLMTPAARKAGPGEPIGH